MTWEIAGTVANILAAVSAATAAIFTYFTVKAAMDTNKLAAEQSELNREYQEKSLRPSLDIKKTSFDVVLEDGFLSDWCEETEGYKPSYASNYGMKVENLGNIPARNIDCSIGIENIEEIKDFIEKNKDSLEQRVSGKVWFAESESPYHVYNVTFTKEIKGAVKSPTFKATFYIEELGYLKSYHSSEELGTQIQLPKLFLILINLLRDQIIANHMIPKLMIKFKYYDPYSTCYHQTFVLKPIIQNMGVIDSRRFIGYFEVKEVLNEKAINN